MVIKRDTGGGKLFCEEAPLPKPGPTDLLVKVKRAGVNRADILQLHGQYPSAKDFGPTVAGMEAAGEVVDTGEAVSGFGEGDRVAGLCPGGYAQYALMDYRLAITVPECLGWSAAGALALGYMTEYNALKQNGGINPEKSVMITAASSGVGVAGIQLARYFGAAPVIGVSGSPDKAQRLSLLGLDRVVDHRQENIGEAARQATGGRGVDVVVDHVGGLLLKDALPGLAVKGRLISVGRLGQALGELDMELLALNRLRIIGATFRTRTLEEKIQIVQGVVSDLMPAVAEGRLCPVVDRVFSLEGAKEAHQYMAFGRQVGKIVLRVE